MLETARYTIRILLALLLPSCANVPRPVEPATIFPAQPAPQTTVVPTENRRMRVLAHMLKLAQKPSYTVRDVNTVLAAGPFSAQEGVSSLLAALDDPQADVREEARQLLWRLPNEFLPELVRHCPKRHRPLAAQIALARGSAAMPLLFELMAWYNDSDADTRLAVFNLAGSLAPAQPDVMDLMRRGLSDEDERIRLFAVSFLIDDPDAVSAVSAVLSTLRLSRDPAVAECANFWWNYQKIRQTSRRSAGR